MVPRWLAALSGASFVFALAASSAAERARTPSDATVFIRVIGTAVIEVEGAFTDEREERGLELGTGSGFVFTPYGHVLTNYHVIEDAVLEDRRGVRVELEVDRIEVVLPAGEGGRQFRLDASVEAVDTDLDLAVLSVAGGELPYLAFGDSASVEPGASVSVYGFPFGNRIEVGKTNVPDIVPQVSVSRGSVSASRTDDSGRTAYLQTTATVNPGNSGGPMVDEDGYVLGVVRLKLRESDGIGFSIPVNAVKDFLTFNGYDQLLAVTRLELGEQQALEGKGLSLRLPETLEDVSPMRLRAFSDPSQAAIRFTADRVVSRWALPQLEQALVSAGTFGSFQAAGEIRSAALGAGGGILGRAVGRDVAFGGDAAMEYAIVEAGGEKVIIRYEGHPDEIAFNRSVLVESLRSLRVAALLTREVAQTVAPDSLAWIERALPAPSAPALSVPESWDEEIAAPFPCRGLPPLESALSISPPGDFTVSLRVGWWADAMSAAGSAAACSERAGGAGEGSYFYTVDWLGERYMVEGLFIEREGTLQLELVAPEAKYVLVRDTARAWMALNGR